MNILLRVKVLLSIMVALPILYNQESFAEAKQTTETAAISADVDRGYPADAQTAGKWWLVPHTANQMAAYRQENGGTVWQFYGETGQDMQSESGATAVTNITALAQSGLQHTQYPQNGYCVILGAGRIDYVSKVAEKTAYHIVVVDPDTDKIENLRKEFEKTGLYGKRVSAFPYAYAAAGLPPYLAERIVVVDRKILELWMPQDLRSVFELLRPYGGRLEATVDQERRQTFEKKIDAAGLPGAKLEFEGNVARLTRAGPMPGAGQWSHAFADSANSSCVRDRELQAPLGLLWYRSQPQTQNGNKDRREGGLRIAGGRLFRLLGGVVKAFDLYTGRALWQKTIAADDADIFPGNDKWVALADAVYIMRPHWCERIDPASGQTLKRFKFPPRPVDADPSWGWIGVAGDTLLAAATPIDLSAENAEEEQRGKNGFLQILERPSTSDISSALVAFNRYSGKPLWSRSASMAFRHSAIAMGGGKIFCIDGLSRMQRKMLKDCGVFIAAEPTLLALDAKSGETVWQKKIDPDLGRLAYSQAKDVLLVFSRKRDPKNLSGRESPTALACGGRDGKLLWEEEFFHDLQPVLCEDKAIVDGREIDLKSGEMLAWQDPVTGTERKLNLTLDVAKPKPVATSNLLFGMAQGYLDLSAKSGVLWPRFDAIEAAGNRVAGDGVLAVATEDGLYAFAKRSGLKDWRYQLFQGFTSTVARAGINFGALGDRRDANGMLWIEKPHIHGTDPGLEVDIKDEKASFFREMPDPARELDWIGSSGVTNPGAIEIKLDYSGTTEERSYKIRLYFQAPQSLESYTTFDVVIQGQKMISSLDVSWETGGSGKMLEKEFTGIAAKDSLRIELVPRRGKPFINGIAIEVENTQRK